MISIKEFHKDSIKYVSPHSDYEWLQFYLRFPKAYFIFCYMELRYKYYKWRYE